MKILGGMQEKNHDKDEQKYTRGIIWILPEFMKT